MMKHGGGVGRGEALPPPPEPTPSFRAAYGLIMRPNDFASYLLAIGICNLLLYFAFYIIMKVSGRGGAAALLYGARGGRWERGGFADRCPRQ